MKKISVNPDFLKIPKKGRRKEKKKEQSLKSNLKPNKIKRDLIRRIKEHNNREREKEKTPTV